VLQAVFTSHQGGNHLTHSMLWCPFGSFPARHFPYQIWVSRTWGLPRSTFIVSNKASSLWHFQGYFAISEDVGILPAVNNFLLPRVISSSMRTPNISVWASTDFPHVFHARLPECYSFFSVSKKKKRYNHFLVCSYFLFLFLIYSIFFHFYLLY